MDDVGAGQGCYYCCFARTTLDGGGLGRSCQVVRVESDAAVTAALEGPALKWGHVAAVTLGGFWQPDYLGLVLRVVCSGGRKDSGERSRKEGFIIMVTLYSSSSFGT